MYIWNIEKLKTDLRTSDLTECNRLLYMLIPAVILFILVEIHMYGITQYEPNSVAITGSILLTLSFALGVILSFFSNGGNRGRYFLDKYFALSFVIQVRLLPVLVIACYLMPVIISYFARDWIKVPENPAVGIEILWQIFFFWRLCVHMKQVR